ncbi:hypothetical protein CQW23_12634 [Capsicum baccatum]|uniref:Uncharacterized protein n=1 Tax=Capsicum baccatum TaxID=33114 RepID=A0A2G2WT35_CAPBA|nr:hypothetical protein CQW23_12634 [Capsicum baccatum]
MPPKEEKLPVDVVKLDCNDGNGVSVAGMTKPDMAHDDLTNDCVQNLGSTSPGSDVILDQKLTDNKESSSPENLGNYLDVGLVQDNSVSYTSPELHQQQDASNLSSFMVNLVLFD